LDYFHASLTAIAPSPCIDTLIITCPIIAIAMNCQDMIPVVSGDNPINIKTILSNKPPTAPDQKTRHSRGKPNRVYISVSADSDIPKDRAEAIVITIMSPLNKDSHADKNRAAAITL
jgi:hypothetical protein